MTYFQPNLTVDRTVGITSSGGAFHLAWNDTRTGKHQIFAAKVPIASS